LVLSFLLLKI